MHFAKRSSRLLHTVRYLKAEQIYWRARMQIVRTVPDARPAPALRTALDAWLPPGERAPCLLGRWQVRFLNLDGNIAQPAQWSDPDKPKLWLYNLHYFDDLSAPADADHHSLQRELIVRWIAENPPPVGNGWESYPVSLRIVNWIKWLLAGKVAASGMLDSLAMQARWLSAHIERHLLGNHILANAKALVFAGLFFAGEEAGGWLREGLAIYAKELREQILADGAHFELSPMYHAIVLEDLFDLINLARHYGVDNQPLFCGLPEITRHMRHWLAAMTHPDGGPSFFNDATFGIAASRAELEVYAGRLGLSEVGMPGEGVHHLEASGYVRVNLGEMAAILDIAAIGPDYIPGHAHADTLSFELSLGAERLIVNGGTSTYAPGPEREAQRATRAHSTVAIGGENSSEVWASFRVARRARVRDVSVELADGEIAIAATHAGYARLAGRPLHRRCWRFNQNALQIKDAIVSSARSIPATAFFHLAPGVKAERGNEVGTWHLTSPRGRSAQLISEPGCELLPDQWSCEFGKSMLSQQLAVPFSNHALSTRINWQ